MITIDSLKECGADTANGIARCADNEEFYIRMVTMALNDTSFETLEEAIAQHDLKAAFERAHAMKGVLGNVGLVNVFAPVSEITEELRAGNDIDYSGHLEKIRTELEKYRALL